MRKKLAIAGAAAFVLLAAAVAVIPRLIDWEKARILLEERGSKALERDLKIGLLDVSLFSGVRVDGFSIGPRPGFSGEPLVKAERMVARYRLLPLLWLKVVIHKIELINPALRIERNRKGEFSFADLVSSAKPAGDKGGTGRPISLPVAINISEVKVIAGRIVYRDASAKPPLSAVLDETDVTVRNLSLSGAPAWLKLESIARVGDKAVPVSFEGSLSFALNRSALGLHDMDMEVPGVRATVNGEISEIQTIPRPEIKTRIVVDLEDAWEAAAALARDYFRPAGSPKGKVAVDVEIEGSSRKPRWRGKAILEKVAYRSKDGTGLLEDLEGEVSFSQEHVSTADLRFIALGNPLALQFDVRDLGLEDISRFDLKGFSPHIKFALTSPRVIVESLLGDYGGPKEEGGDAPVREKPPPPMQEPDLRRLVPAGLSVNGEIRLESVKFRDIEFEDGRATLSLKERKMKFTQEARIYGGRQAASGTVNLAVHPVRHSTSVRVEGTQTGPLIDAAAASFLGAASAGLVRGRISGSANAHAKLAGRGITPENLARHGSAAGNILIAKGSLARPGIVARLSQLLGQAWMKKDFSFESLGGDFSYGEGKATTPAFVMDPGPSGDLHASFKGEVDLDARIKGELTTRFHPRHADSLMSGEVGKLQFSRAEDGWVVGDWQVSGSLSKPLLTPSVKNVKKRAVDRAKDELKEQAPKLKEEGKKLLKKLFR